MTRDLKTKDDIARGPTPSPRSSRRLRCAFLRFRRGAARAQAVDVAGAEAQLLENRLIVLSKRGRAPCRHFGDAMHLNRTADRRGQLAAGAFERNDDVIRAQLWIVDHLLRLAHDAEGDVDAIEDPVPMRPAVSRRPRRESPPAGTCS